MSPSPGRLAAARTLVDLEQRGGHADEVYGRHAGGVRGPERGLGWALVLGVERNRTSIDHALNRHLSRHPRDLDPPVRAVLRSAVFQLWRMDRVPDRAAVHQAVEVTKALGARRAAGLVNAALRSLLRHPDRAGEPEDPWVQYSMPRWILTRMPPDSAAAFNGEPVLAVRPRRPDLVDRWRELGVEVEPPPPPLDRTDALLVRGGDPTALPGWDEGWFAIQDAAAQAVALLVGAAPGESVLDLCAAPGGKTFALADAVGPPGRVVGIDISERRMSLLRTEAGRLGHEGVETLIGDALELAPAAPHRDGYDRVLVDAPCSALGTLRRHPELRWQRRGADLPRFATQQGELLGAAARAVRPGGRLVYAVCSFAPEEGEQVVESFLDGGGEFKRDPVAEDWGVARTDRGDLSTHPGQGPWDAFYAAVLRRIA